MFLDFYSLGHEIAHFQILATSGVTYFVTISLAQITILRCLYINNWGRMVMVEDNFIARICYQFNLLICFMFTMTKVGLEQYHGNYHYHAARNLFGLQGGPLDQKTYKRISFWYFWIVFEDLPLDIIFISALNFVSGLLVFQ